MYTVGRFLTESTECPEHISPNNNNNYTLIKTRKHNIVIAILPNGEHGIASAATVARDTASLVLEMITLL